MQETPKKSTAEEQLHKFLSVLDKTTDLILITDKDGIIEYANPFFLQTTGYTAEEILGQTPRILQSGFHSSSFFRDLWNTLLSGNAFHAEFLNRKKNGEIFVHEAELIPIRNEKQEITHFASIGRDVTLQRRLMEDLKSQEELEKKIAEISTKFITLPPERIDAGIQDVLHLIGSFAGVDRSYVFLYSSDGKTLTNTHEWCAPGVSPQKDRVQCVPVDAFPWATKKMLTGNILHIPRVADLPPEASLEKEEFERQQIQSLVMIPMSYAGKIIGFVGFDSVSKQRKWTDKRIGLLRIAADLFANAMIRKESEHALQISEDRYRTLAEAAQDSIYIVDRSFRVSYVNTTGASWLGLPAKEVVEKSVSDILPSSIAKRLISNVRNVMSSGSAIYTEGNVSLTENERWLGTWLIPLRSKTGSIGSVMGVSRDITNRIRIETALRKSEEKYRTLFEESKDTVFFSTPDGKILDINPAGVELFGYSSKEHMLTLNVARDFYFHPEDRRRSLELLEQQGYLKDHEITLKKKNGEKLIVLETSTVVRDTDGKVTGYRGIIRDVTHVRELQERLLQSQKMETVGQLAGGVAHDFNNILTAIGGYCELLLLKLPSDDPIRSELEELLRAQQQGVALTRRLMAFGRRQVMEMRTLEANELVTGMEGILRRLIRDDIELLILRNPRPLHIEADPIQMEQVIMNLAVNAGDAMPQGGKLTIELNQVILDENQAESYPDAVAASYVRISVSDTGIGIDHHILNHIFEPFFTTKDKGKGTGLGLAVVYGIVRQTHGFLTVDSEEGKGSTFHVHLPQAKPAERLQPAEKDGEAPARGSEMILLVDDNEGVRNAIGTILNMQGYTVLQAAQGSHAMELSSNYPGEIHLLISDVVMPELSGRELAKSLLKQRPELKVLYMSGYTDEAIGHHGVLDPGATFLQKPVPIQTLLRTIRDILDS